MIIDLTHTIKPGIPVYPGDPQPAFFKAATLTANGYRATRLDVSSHVGTHMDAPSHLLRDGASLDVLPISQFCGRAAVLDVSDLPEGGVITSDYLHAHREELLSADYALFYTGWEKKWNTPEYLGNFPVPDTEAARYLISCGLKGTGTDALSMDSLRDADMPVHRALLEGGLVIVENLCLRKIVGRRDVMFFALPMKYGHADGAPVRAVAEFREFPEREEENA